MTPDGRSGPVIDATITFPPARKHVPALIDYTYIWPANFNLAALAGNGPQPPDSVKTALDHGFAHVAYRPQLLQSDSGATMKDGVIGLPAGRATATIGVRCAPGPGVQASCARSLRAIPGSMASASRSSAIRASARRVAAAFDPAFADADVSSSGAGGAKLMRRNFGETWGNLLRLGGIPLVHAQRDDLRPARAGR